MAIIRRFLQLLSLITLLFITAEVNVNQKLRMLLVCLVIMITCFKKESMCLLFQVGWFSREKKDDLQIAFSSSLFKMKF